MHFYDRLSIHQKQAFWAWVFLAVPVVFFVVVRFYPTSDAARISLTNWSLFRQPQFIGLDNYVKMFQDPVFWKVFANTFKYLAIGLPVSLLISFAVAYYLDRVRFMHGLIRGLYFVP